MFARIQDINKQNAFEKIEEFFILYRLVFAKAGT